MKLPRRQFLHLAAGAAALPAMPRTARAQSYPSRPVRIIVAFAPAGSSDIVARPMGQWLSERLGQPIVVDNRSGANGNIGTEAAVKAPPDGHTLLQISSVNAFNATLYDNFRLARVGRVCSLMSAIGGRPDNICEAPGDREGVEGASPLR
jgi:tripartite-type tricarboxylate transporter receptor subunit TctC